MKAQQTITYTTQDGRTISLPAKLVGSRGYAASPGSGPIGETCGSCKHHVVRHYSKRYHKCDLVAWTRGAGTDIRVRAPSCRLWEKAVEPRPVTEVKP